MTCDEDQVDEDQVEEEQVVLVDENGLDKRDSDGNIETMGKLDAHRQGVLHRAVSVFLFRRDELLLQKRAPQKYHSRCKWANSCCTHPFVGETPETAAKRRLGQEMGIEAELTELFPRQYKANVGQALTGEPLIEHEYDHVFGGWWDGTPQPASNEVSDWRWISLSNLQAEVRTKPDDFAPWFTLFLRDHGDALRQFADKGQA